MNDVPKVIIKFTISDGKGKSFTESEDYSELVNEWITNGVNGTKEDVLSSIKEGTFKFSEVKNGDVAYGYIESLAQSRNCPQFILNASYSELTIAVECLENEYVKKS
ncbi:MAG: hypothetical protein ACOCQR_00835 [bacterium]